MRSGGSNVSHHEALTGHKKQENKKIKCIQRELCVHHHSKARSFVTVRALGGPGGDGVTP